VTCVAVSRPPHSCIVSGGEDCTVRLWGRNPATGRWQERDRLDHDAVVRAVACTPPGARGNLLLTATASGRGYLFDLDHLERGARTLEGRHSGAILAAAFSADGSLCATGGGGRAICLWRSSDGG
jgi:WD40 repeat protein